MDGPEGWESMTRGYRCVGSGSQTFCPWEAVAEMEWRGRYLEMKSRDREPRVWDGWATEATLDGGGSRVEKAVSPLPKSSVSKGSDQEGGGHGLRSGLNLREWRGNGCGLGEQGGW